MKSNKKLRLNKETLRNLDHAGLRGVGGGAILTGTLKTKTLEDYSKSCFCDTVSVKVKCGIALLRMG